MSKKGIDYSKWDTVELSDDDSDCHPNIEKDFWLRIKKEKREKEKEDNMKEVLELQKGYKVKRAEADSLDIRAGAAADDAERAAIEAKAAALREGAEAQEKRAAKIIESERKRNWDVTDKFDYSAVNVKGLEIGAGGAKAKAKPTAADAAAAAGRGGGGGGGGEEGAGDSGGRSAVAHDPSHPAAAGAPAAEAQGGDGDGDDDADADEQREEAELSAYVAGMEAKAQELGCIGNEPDCFDQSYEIIKKYPEVAVKETTDYLLLVGNDLAKRGEEELGRAFVHQSLMMQYCMDLSKGGANGVQQFFKRMNAPEPAVRARARGHFESELDEYWGKIVARARGIAKDLAFKEEQAKMLDVLKPPEA